MNMGLGFKPYQYLCFYLNFPFFNVVGRFIIIIIILNLFF